MNRGLRSVGRMVRMNAMFRRAMALAMLFLTAATSFTQGLELVLCDCTGGVFLGSPPPACCEECPGCLNHPSHEAEVAMQSPSALLESSECLTVLERGWDTYPPHPAGEGAPSLALVEVPAFSISFTDAPGHGALPRWSAFQQAAPPGCDLVVVLGSLRI